MEDSLCIYALCYNRALRDCDELRCQLFSDNKGALLTFCHAKPCTQQPLLDFLLKITVNSGL